MNAWRHGLLVLLTAVCTALPGAAQPRLTNARVTERAVAGSLEATVRELTAASREGAWIGWESPSVPRSRDDSWCWSEGAVIEANRLEPSDALYVFLRVEAGRIERVRRFDNGCPVDAGNRPVVWLRGVKPSESVAFLAGLAADPAPDSRVRKGALAALAGHAGPEAARPLVRLARQAPESRTRSEALFWLAQRAGAEATAAITDAIANDPETDVKKRAVFALSQLPADDGVPKLIEVARTHRNPAVRKQAMFWLGQSKDARAIAFFEEILR